MSSGGSFYVDAVQRSHIDHAVLYIPPCRTTLLWKDSEKQQAYRWDIEDNDFNLKEFESSDENYKEKLAGNVAWYPDTSLESEQAGSHISFDAPINRHFFQESTYLSKKVYSCGKEITPEPPYKVIGVMKKRVLLPDNKESTYLPYIAVYENKLTIGFYWLLTNQDSQEKEWVRKGEIKLPELPTYETDDLPSEFDVEYLVTNCVYFSQDSTKAVTYCALKKAKKVNFYRMAYLVYNVPIRIDITIDSLGNISHSTTEVADVSISNLPYKINLIITSEIASEFINNTRKPFIVSSNYDVLNFYFQNVRVKDEDETVSHVTCQFDAWGKISWLIGMNMWYFGYTVRPVSWDSPADAEIEYASNIKGFAGREIFNIPSIEKIINSVCIPLQVPYTYGEGSVNEMTAYMTVEYFGYENDTIFDLVEITNYPQHFSINEIESRLSPLNLVADISTHKRVTGTFRRFPREVLYISYRFDYGNTEKTFIDSSYELFAGQHINATNEVGNPPFEKPPHAAVETPASTPMYELSGNYTSEPTEDDTRIASFNVKGYSMKGGVSDVYLQNASQPYLKMSIAVLDIANNITVLAGYNKLILYKGTEKKEFNFSYLAPKFIVPCFFSLDGSIQNGYRNTLPFDDEFPNPASAQVNMAGVWSNISGIQYASDKFGNYILKYGNENYLSNGQTFNGFNNLGVI